MTVVLPSWFSNYTGKLSEYQYGVVLAVLFLVCVTLTGVFIAQRSQRDAEEFRYEQMATYMSVLVVGAGILYFSLGHRWGKPSKAKGMAGMIIKNPTDDMDKYQVTSKVVTGITITAITLLVILYKQWAKYEHKHKHHHHGNRLWAKGSIRESNFQCPADRHTERKSTSITKTRM